MVGFVNYHVIDVAVSSPEDSMETDASLITWLDLWLSSTRYLKGQQLQ